MKLSRDERRLKPEDLRDELINTLSGSDCVGLAYEAVTWRTTTQTRRLERWTNQYSFRLWLRGFSVWGCHVTNDRLKPEDSRDELINTLSGSDCRGLAYEAVTWRTTTQTRRLKRWTNQYSFRLWLRGFSVWSCHVTNDDSNPKTREMN